MRQKRSSQNWQGVAEKLKREAKIQGLEAEGKPRERPEKLETGNPHANGVQFGALLGGLG